MSGIISVIIWIVIMAAVSGVLKGKSNGSGTKDRNPYNARRLCWMRRITCRISGRRKCGADGRLAVCLLHKDYMRVTACPRACG